MRAKSYESMKLLSYKKNGSFIVSYYSAISDYDIFARFLFGKVPLDTPFRGADSSCGQVGGEY